MAGLARFELAVSESESDALTNLAIAQCRRILYHAFHCHARLKCRGEKKTRSVDEALRAFFDQRTFTPFFAVSIQWLQRG